MNFSGPRQRQGGHWGWRMDGLALAAAYSGAQTCRAGPHCPPVHTFSQEVLTGLTSSLEQHELTPLESFSEEYENRISVAPWRVHCRDQVGRAGD